MKDSVNNLQDGFIRYHGCGIYRRDGRNVLVTKRGPCYKPTNACFWMLDEDVKKKFEHETENQMKEYIILNL